LFVNWLWSKGCILRIDLIEIDWSAVEAVGTWATALIAVGGIVFVRRQLQQVERTIRGDTHERLTTESFEVLKFLASEPKSYPHFYEGKSLEESCEIRVFIRYAAELLANYMEHVIAQRPNMSSADWKVWERFLSETLSLAPVVRGFLRSRKGWYSAELVSMSDKIDAEKTKLST
jgi:hypothetical protein